MEQKMELKSIEEMIIMMHEMRDNERISVDYEYVTKKEAKHE